MAENQFSKTLRSLIDQYGQPSTEMTPRFKSILQDVFVDHPREKNLLIAGLEEGIPRQLSDKRGALPYEMFSGQLIERLENTRAINHDSAEWVVLTWADAMGYDIPAQRIQSRVMKPSDPPYSKPNPQRKQQYKMFNAPDLKSETHDILQPQQRLYPRGMAKKNNIFHPELRSIPIDYSTDFLSDSSRDQKSTHFHYWQGIIILVAFLILQIFTFNIVPLVSGYMVRGYSMKRGEVNKIGEYRRLFIDGWKINSVTILYVIPFIILALAFGVIVFLSEGIGKVTYHTRIDVILAAFIVIFIISPIINTKFVHFFRSNHILDPFSIGAISQKISEGIGWGDYCIICCINWMLMSILLIVILARAFNPFLGWIAGSGFFLLSVFLVKIYRNICNNIP